MRLISWNVNGIRAVDRKGELTPFLERYAPSISLIQETKAQSDSYPKNGHGYQRLLTIDGSMFFARHFQPRFAIRGGIIYLKPESAMSAGGLIIFLWMNFFTQKSKALII